MLHKHRCENPHCTLIFEHEQPDTSAMQPAEGAKFYEDQHRCPRCNTGPYLEKFFANPKEREIHKKAYVAEILQALGADDPRAQLLAALLGL